MVRNQVGGVPVVKYGENGEKLVGVLTHRDIILSHFTIATGSLQVQDLMSSRTISSHPNANLKDVLKLMLENKVERLPVVDDRNYLIGLISHGDILRKDYDHL